MLRLFSLLFFITFIMIGCDSSDSKPLDTDVKESLLITKAPINNTLVPTNQKVYLEFSTSLDAATVNSSTAYMIDENNDSVGLYIGFGNPDSKITLTPYTFLEPSTNYTIVVTTALKDINGYSLSENYRYQFTTQADSVDTSPLSIKSLKPERDATSALVQSEISIDFSKNLSLEPQYTSSEYLRVTDVNGSVIAGSTEVFNSILKFIPDQALPYEEIINVALVSEVEDMYGGIFSDLTAASWSFTTKSEIESPQVNLGYLPFTSIASTKQSYLVRTIYNTTQESKIAVATQDGIDIYLVHYTTALAPTFEFINHYDVASKINAMVSVVDKYLVVGTMSNGVYLLEILPTSVVSRGNYITTQSVYGLSIGVDDQGSIDKLYAVGPELGLQIFDFDTTGNLTPTINTQLGEALDVVEATEYDIYASAVVRKIYVADYNGSVVVCDENGTFISRTDLNMSVKKLTFNEDYNGKMGLLAIGSSGKMQGLDFAGAISSYVKLDLLSNIYDIKSYVDSNNMISKLYFSGGSSGVLVTSGDYPNSIIDTVGRVVSSDVVIDIDNDASYLVTLDEDGTLNLFNALSDISSPYAFTTPYNGEIVSTNGFSFVVSFFDKHLDVNTITQDSFMFFDLNNSVVLPFALDVAGIEYKLTPLSPLSPNSNYSVTISGEIADLMGNKLNGGVDNIVSFETNSDAILPTLSISNVSEAEDKNITFNVVVSAASTVDIAFDYKAEDISATEGVDYTPTAGSVIIPAGSFSALITVPILQDSLVEGDEQFKLTTSNVVNATFSTLEVVGTIIDDD